MSRVPKIGKWQYFWIIFKKEDEVSFLHADKHESFLQVDANILGTFDQT